MEGGDILIRCAIAGVSKSGYYRWLKKRNEPPHDLNDYLVIKDMFDQGKHKDGWRTLKMKLETQKNITFNHKKIIRIKKKYGLVTRIRRKNPYKAIFKKTQEHRVAPNILDRQFLQTVPFKFLCTDITYVFFGGHVAYLSAVKDIASGEILAWNLARHLAMNLVLDTVLHMENNPQVPGLQGVLLHSDQGFHYTNPEYASRLERLGMIQSMSRLGNCIDNSPMETFFGHFKDEVDYQACQTFEQLKAMIQDYITRYNTQRQQWELKKMTPQDYRNHLLLAQS